MAAAKKSKNSRIKSTGPAKFVQAGDVRRIKSLNGGNHCYLLTDDGRTLHLATGSEAFTDAVRAEVAAGAGTKLRAELAELATAAADSAWPAVADRLAAAEVFAG